VYPETTIRQKRSRGEYESGFQQLPISEMRKRFTMLPEETVRKTMENTTQYYTEIEEENRTNQEKHLRKRFKAIQYNR